MSLIETKLGDLAMFQRGFDITKNEQAEGDVPVVSSGGISSYHNVHKVKGPGVIVGRKGTLGTVHYVESNYWPHDTTLWIKDFKGNNPKFMFYFLQTLKLERFDAGASNPTLNRNHIHKLQVKIPDSKSRIKIASALSAYDDLIENNNQRIALLEQMAEEIYKEWFVRLRFPGYQKTKIIDGVPEGWGKLRFRECLKHYIGGGWGEEIADGKNSIPGYVLRGTDIPNFKIGLFNYEVLRFHSKSNLSSRVLIESDLVFEVSGGTEDQSLGRSAIVTHEILKDLEYDLICASFCKLIRVDSSIISPLYIYGLLNRLYKTGELMVFQVQSTGISNYQFEDFIDFQKILSPPEKIQEQYENVISPILSEIHLLGKQNQVIKKTRDLLLPRLISGKLSVEHLVDEEILEMSAL